MKNGYVALLDSGIGGISLLLQLKKILPNENYLYLGDNKNAPYGNKHLSELREITFKNIDLIKRYDVKLLVLACNTLSVNLINEITAYSGLKTFGVFPPVEKALMESKYPLLLATERTAENYKEIKGLTTFGLKYLAKHIEYNMFNLGGVNVWQNLLPLMNKNANEKQEYDTVILGCTHYFFVKDKIFDHLKPQKILFGEEFTAKSVKNFLEQSKSLGNNKQNQVLFIGENASVNQNFFNFYSRKKEKK